MHVLRIQWCLMAHMLLVAQLAGSWSVKKPADDETPTACELQDQECLLQKRQSHSGLGKPEWECSADQESLLQVQQSSASSLDPVPPKCASSWSRLHPGDAISAMHVRSKQDDSSFNASRISDVFIYPPAKFAFCTIAKNGCTTWTTLQNKLLASASANHSHYTAPYASQNKYGPEGLASVFQDPNAVRVVLLRDPLARFASAFLDKAFTNGCRDTHAAGIRAFAKKASGQALSMSDAVGWMLSVNPANPSMNIHWKLQSQFCGLSSRLHEYTVVGMIDKQRHAQDASCILEMAGLSRYNHQVGFTGPPLFGDPVNPSGTPSGDSKHGMTEEDILKKLYTTEAARKLISHFHADYETFHFLAEPSWVKEATGEWFETVSQDACHRSWLSLMGANTDLQSSSHHEHDDVVSLALDVGFPLLTSRS